MIYIEFQFYHSSKDYYRIYTYDRDEGLPDGGCRKKEKKKREKMKAFIEYT